MSNCIPNALIRKGKGLQVHWSTETAYMARLMLTMRPTNYLICSTIDLRDVHVCKFGTKSIGSPSAQQWALADRGYSHNTPFKTW